MATFYHIDRTNQLKENTIINLNMFKDVKSEDNNDYTSSILQNTLDEMFPLGVSNHGEQYFVSGSLFNDTNADIELIFELIRKCSFPTQNSRFQSFFAIDELTVIPMLQRLQANPEFVSIWEVDCDNYSKHDMNLLSKSSNLVNVSLANLYWNGETLGNPLYEYLLKPPVKIIRRVSLSEFLNNY